jgi:hypothetical protein
MTDRDVSKYDDLIDSRDVIARIEALEGERDDFNDAEDARLEGKTEAEAAEMPGRLTWTEENTDDAEELAALLALQGQAEGYADDWRHGTTLIRDSYFEDYAREFAEDIGAIPEGLQWPCTCIDWEQAARELRQDYTSVEFDGITYWVR